MARLVVAAALLLGCTSMPRVSAPQDLPLKRVAVYRNGVGYFERAGKVHTDRLQFKVKGEHVGDFLATLAVMEKGGSSVRAAAFPLRTKKRNEPPPPPDPSGRPAPPAREELDTVVLELDGRDHELAVGYVTEQPVWKPSYRLVLDDAGPTLQAWGIVQNLSGEDWNDVRLSLIAGAPIAFQATLQTPVTPRRPVVSDTGELIAAVPRSESTYAQPPPPAMAEAMPGMAAPPSAPMARPAPKRSSKKAEAPSAAELDDYAGGGTPYVMADAAPRNLALLAAQTVEGGATRYDLPHPVTVPNDSATMVLLLAERVKGEAVYMFAPEGGVPDSSRHPFRVARFTNTTRGLLERGPLAVYEASSFLGQGVLESLSAGGHATVPFALERGIAVERDQQSTVEDARLAQIEHGALRLERDQVLKTTYRLRNGGDKAVKLLVRHPRVQGMRLHRPPAGTEDQVGGAAALVPAAIPSLGSGELKVDERRAYPTSADWMSPEADQAVRAYLADKRADPKIAGALRAAWTLRETIRKAGEEREKLVAEKQILDNASEETRANLRAIQRNKAEVEALRKQLSERLVQLDTRLAQVNQRLVQLDLDLNENRVRFQETLRDVKLTEPLPPLDA